MILPGDVFIETKKIMWKEKFHIGFFLVLINTFVFLFVSAPELLNDKKNNQIKKQNQLFQTDTLKNMFDQTQSVDAQGVDAPIASDQGSLSFLKDRLFWDRSQKFPFQGDAVAIAKNKQMILELKNLYQESTQFKFGLGPEATTPWAWLTYQFMHAGFIHLLMNMIFLILIANILIHRVSQEWILLIYVVGGIGAGISYLFFAANNDIAMVGASGSLCALISFLCVVENKKNIQWSYFISPMKDGYGIIYMPAYLLFPVYLISDFTSVLYHASGVAAGAGGAVAHSAHIGGALTGFFLGFVHIMLKQKSNSILPEQSLGASCSR